MAPPPPPSAENSASSRADHGLLAQVFQKRYREVTPEAILFGVLIGVVMNAAITYSGLKIGFTLGGSAIAAVLGWGVLRGVLNKGSVVENNLAQTIASSVNTSNSGVIFTIPVLFMMGIHVPFGLLAGACVAGAILGVAFIIPTRKQMIELDRLRFPTGTAVAAVLKSPGEGVRKSQVLLTGIFVSMVLFFFTQADVLDSFGIPTYANFGLDWLSADALDMGAALRSFGIPWPENMSFIWALAPFALGAGFITGRPGLFVLAGGVLAFWIITPVMDWQGWIPGDVAPADMGGWARDKVNRPLGIGMLMGGAFIGLLVAFPAIKAALGSMRQGSGQGGSERSELPLSVLYVAVVLAFLVLFGAALGTISDGSVGQAALIATVGTVWMWFSGIIIAQCTGMTDWSPISGMALLTVMICLLLTGNQVGPAVLIGGAVCVSITLCADMMQDLKTGHMVGSLPLRQQFMELLVVGIGPIVCLGTLYLIAKSNLQAEGIAFGGERSPAPQAQALMAAIEGIRGGDAPVHLYGMGGLLGALLSLAAFSGLGVLVGLSMYLPLVYLLPYGLGCLIQMGCQKKFGTSWCENWGVPFAAGLLVGEGLLGVAFGVVSLLQ